MLVSRYIPIKKWNSLRGNSGAIQILALQNTRVEFSKTSSSKQCLIDIVYILIVYLDRIKMNFETLGLEFVLFLFNQKMLLDLSRFWVSSCWKVVSVEKLDASMHLESNTVCIFNGNPSHEDVPYEKNFRNSNNPSGLSPDSVEPHEQWKAFSRKSAV